MAELTINISDTELMLLEALAKSQNTTKTEIIRSALKRFFKENLIDKQTIVLQKDQFQALTDLIDKPLTEHETEGRKRLKEVPDWDL